MKIFSLLEIQYQKMTEAIREYLSDNMGLYGNAYGNATIFGQFINVLKGVTQNIMLYIEDALTEQNKYTAQRKKSIYGLASLSGYQPSTGKACKVKMNIRFTNNNYKNTNIIINNHEQMISSQNGLQYNLILPSDTLILSVAKNNSLKELYAVQGSFDSQTFVSSGGKLYTQSFTYQGNIDLDYLSVTVNGETWEKEDSLYDMDADGKQYTYNVGYKGGINIIFGNDIHGRALQSGDTIVVTYLIHDGETGNLSIGDTNSYFIFNNSLQTLEGDTIDGNNVFNIYANDSDNMIAGSNSETKDSVRLNIGYNSRSLVLADVKNYKNIISKFSFCGYNRTWADKLSVKSLIMKDYSAHLDNGNDYFSLTDEDFKLSTAQKNSIKNNIINSGSMIVGSSYDIVDPILSKYALFVYVSMKSGKENNQEYITTNIQTLVGEFFANVNSDLFIPKSDIIQLIKSNIDDIDGVNVYFLSERNETAIINKNYIDNNNISIHLDYNENPNLGLDNHGNILLNDNETYPVLMGGWKYKNNNDTSNDIIAKAITIVFE